MIVQATHRKTIDVEINPVSVIHDIEEFWKLMNKLPIDADLKAGYWVHHNFTEVVRIRLATQLEMLQYNALETVREIAREL